MGYGSRALQLLKQYYEMKILNINENAAQEPVMEIKNVPDEAVDLLEESIGNLLFNLLFISIVSINYKFINIYLLLLEISSIRQLQFFKRNLNIQC